MIPRNCENQGIIFHTCVGALAQREQRFIKLKISVIPLQARLTGIQWAGLHRCAPDSDESCK